MQRATNPEHTASDREQLPLAVVRAIADHGGTDPTDLERPLADVIDPEALARLFSPREDGSPGVEGRVVFRYEDYGVAVDADGEIDVFDAVREPSLLR